MPKPKHSPNLNLAAAAISGFRSAMTPPDTRPPSLWAEDNIMIEHSERKPGKFDRTYAPWLSDPIDWLASPDISEVTLLGPVQSGKSQALEIWYAWALCNAPRPTIITAQSDNDTEGLWSDKFLRTLKASPATAAMIDALPHDSVKKNKAAFPLMITDVQGPSEHKIQSKTRPYLLCDEAWRYELGRLAQIKKRKDSATGGKLMVVSQAGRQIGKTETGEPVWDDLGMHYHTGTCREYEWPCPKCGAMHCPETSQFEWDGQDPQTKAWDFRVVHKTIRWRCPTCEGEIRPGETKEERQAFVRTLVSRGGYSAPRNPNHNPAHESVRLPVWVVWWKDWGEMAEEYIRAKNRWLAGAPQDYETWTKQREVKFWRIGQADTPVTITRPPAGYCLADYKPDGDNVPRVDGERVRIMAVDVQAAEYKIVIRAFGQVGSRQLLHTTVVRNPDEIRRIQLAYRVPNNLVFLDAGKWRQEVFSICAKFGWRALVGMDKAEGWVHQSGARRYTRPYSPYAKGAVAASARNAYAVYWTWSNMQIKDTLSSLAAGRGEPWELPDDMDNEMTQSMGSERKDPVTGIWRQIGSIPNHYWDCECMILVGGMATGMIDIGETLEVNTETAG